MRFPTLLFASLAIAGCSPDSPDGSAPDAGPAAETPGWHVLIDAKKLDRVAVSVWGPAPDDVFVVGGSLGNGAGPLVLQWDGSTFHDLSPGGDDSFWWVHGTSATDVWMVGEHGRVAHFDGTTITDGAPLTTATLWGVWAGAPDDVYVVGGTPGAGTSAPNDLLFHYDGQSWTEVTLPGAPRGASLYKVWGVHETAGPDEVFVVGEGGTLWQSSASTSGPAWVLVDVAASGTLFTTNGCAKDDVWAVGDFDVFHFDGQTWSSAKPMLTGRVYGVACNPAGGALLVGSGGQKQRYANGAWTSDFSAAPHEDLHGAWSDGKGGYWAVGGDFSSSPTPGQRRPGVIGRFVPLRGSHRRRLRVA